ncbi:BMP family protein [Candidatus Bipolaricaulota bacterium]|nr:BMP family protein [Candidatus Bipolaricaulota bacterium]
MKNFEPKLAVFAVVLVLITGLLVPAMAQSKAPDEYEMVLILPGPINDQSWNAANYAGLQAVNSDLGADMEYVENVQASDFESTFKSYGRKGYDLVIAAGTQFNEAARSVAPDYPDTHYLIVNGNVSKDPNLSSVKMKEWESGFLSGILMGYAVEEWGEEDPIIGQIGGFPNRLMKYALNGVTLGARMINEDISVVRSYANSWSDIGKGRELASSMVEKGADAVFCYANQVGLGAIEAAKGKAKYVGFASNQNSVAPDTVVASVLYDYGVLYKLKVEQFMNGNLEPKVSMAGVREGVVNIEYNDIATEEMKETVSEAREMMIEGEILDMLTRPTD